MTSKPVSIIVPVYNTEKYLRVCIDSILSQTFGDFECILVDDCSPDNCPEICDEYAKKDNRIMVVHKKQNGGLPQARKTGLEISTGNYTLNVDSDDWIENDMVEKMYSMAISNNYDMVYCDWYHYDELNNKKCKKPPCLTSNFVSNIKLIDFDWGGVIWNKIIKKNVCQKIIFPEYSIGEDTYITTQILYYSKNIGYVNAALYNYRYNPVSLINNPKLVWKRNNERRENSIKILNFLKEKYGEDLSIFAPELGNLQKVIKNCNPKTAKNMIKAILLPIISSKTLKRKSNVQ